MESTYHVFKNSVTVHVNGHTATISKDDKRYPKVMEIIKDNNMGDMEGALINAECISRIETLLGLE